MKDDTNTRATIEREPDTQSRRRSTAGPRRRGTTVRQAARPTHYKVICISMYTRDIEQLEAKVAELKRRGFTKANKSQLIRLALSQLEVESVAGDSCDDLERVA